MKISLSLFFLLTGITTLSYADSSLFCKLDSKWKSPSNRDIQFQKGIGYVTAKNARYHRLFSPEMNLDAGKYNLVELTVSGKPAGSKLYFRNKNSRFAESSSVRGEYRNGKLRFFCGDNRNWTGNIAWLRFDFNTAGLSSPIAVSSMTLLWKKIPPYPVLLEEWQETISLKPEQTVQARCDLPRSTPITYTIKSTVPLQVGIQYFDILGQKRGQYTMQMPSAGTGSLPWDMHASQAEFQIRNPAKEKADFSLELAQKELRNPPKPDSVHVEIENAPPPAADETISWVPQVSVKGLDAAPRRLALLLVNGNRKLQIGEVPVCRENTVYRFPQISLRYLTPGNYQIEAELDGVRCGTNSKSFTHIRKTSFTLPSVTLNTQRLRPYYQINGTEKADTMELLLGENSDRAVYSRQVDHAVQAGIKGIRLRIIFRFHPDGTIDFREIDEMIQSILLRHPQVNLMLVVSVTDPGPQWRTRHPEEGIRNAAGEYRIRNYRESPEATASMASRNWRKASIHCIRSLVEHLKSIPGGERVIGITPCAGITWEWLNWGSARGEMVDYSEHFRQFFIQLMHQRYSGSLSELNHAWRTSFSDFSEIRIPSPHQRNTRQGGDFLFFPGNKYLADHIDSNSILIAEIIDELCRTVKESSGGKILAGTYYGDSNYLTGIGRNQDAGHNQLAMLLQSKWIDFLVAPSRYAGREIGGAGGFMFPEGSILLHGKGVISECDIRPFSADSKLQKVSTHKGSAAVLEREFGMQLARRTTMRWFDFGKGWITEEPRLLDLVKKISAMEQSHAEDHIHWKKRDSIAVYTAPATSAWMERESRLFTMLLEENYRQLGRSGTAFDMYLTSDLARVPEEHRMSIFLNAHKLTQKEKDLILRKLCRKGHTLIVCHGIGICGGEKPDLTFMERLFGCKFILSAGQKIQKMKLTAKGKEVFGSAMNGEISSSDICGPVFHPAGSIQVLARNEDGEITAMETDKNGCRLIFLSHPNLEWQWIHSIADTAGLPTVMTNAQPAWIGNDFAVLHTKKGGLFTVKLPSEADGMQDCLTKEHIPFSGKEIPIQLAPESTRIYRITYRKTAH